MAQDLSFRYPLVDAKGIGALDDPIFWLKDIPSRGYRNMLNCC